MKPYPKIIAPPPGPRARAIIARDEAFAAPCYIKEYPLVIARGPGGGAMIFGYGFMSGNS
jgi:hypothetical protein